MRRRNKTLSLVIAFIFALTFLGPTFGMPGTAAAYPGQVSDSGGDLKVVTDTADDVEDDEATLQAYVKVDEDDYDDDTYEITEYGFFYGYDEDDVDEVEDILDDEDDDWACKYEYGDDLDYNGDDRFEFYLSLNNLDEDETVYYRAYIEYTDDDDDTYYSLGKVKKFDVDESSGSDVPELATNSASSIKSDSAVLNGKLTSLGDGKKITEYGFYYGTTSSASTKKKVGDDDDRLKKGDTFDFKLSGLKPDTKYYFKSYAKSSEGIGYGSVKSFTTAEDKEDTPVVTTTSSVFTIGSSYYALNGSSQAMDAAPYIKNSRTYMPIRYVGYAMGLTDAQIQWYEATRTVILTKGSTTVVLVIGSPTMFVNGQARVMDVAPEITNSRTCLPIAWVAAAFGHTAVWNGATQQVTIAGVKVPGVSKGELKLSRSSLTLEPGDDATITGTLSVDIDDVDYNISGDRVVTVKTTITGTSFKATIKANSGADDGDEATITFTVTDNNGNKYEAELDVAVEDDSGSEVEVSTSKATSITKDSARLNGAVTDDGDLDIKRFGFYYGTNKSQVSKGEDGSADYSKGKGSESKFYLDLDDLDSNKKYYFMAYAVDEDSDITYGKVLDFTTKK